MLTAAASRDPSSSLLRGAAIPPARLLFAKGKPSFPEPTGPWRIDPVFGKPKVGLAPEILMLEQKTEQADREEKLPFLVSCDNRKEKRAGRQGGRVKEQEA